MNLSTHGIVALVRDQSGNFLLLEDAREPMRGCWAPPHGRCEPTGSSEEEGLIREVREETALLVRPVRKVLTQPADTKIRTVSFWIVTGKQEDPVLNEESSAFGWYSADEALKLKLYPGTRSFFEMLQASKIQL